jgi:hypothetical protein
MTLALRVTLTILGIVAIGRALAAATSPAWRLGEFILLAAFIVLVRECIKLRETAQDLKYHPAPGLRSARNGPAGDWPGLITRRARNTPGASAL